MALVLAAAVAYGERPFDTEDTAALDRGRAQLEASALYARGPARADIGAVAGVFTLGLARGLDVAVQGTEIVADAGRRDVRGGVGDTQLQAKWLLWEEASARPAFLVSPVVRLPTADGPLGLPGVDVHALGAASKTIASVVVTGNAGYTFATEDRRRDFWTLAASCVWAWTERWSLGGEAVAGLGSARRRDLAFVRAGALWTVREGIVLDAGIAWGVRGSLPDAAVTVGATVDLF